MSRKFIKISNGINKTPATNVKIVWLNKYSCTSFFNPDIEPLNKMERRLTTNNVIKNVLDMRISFDELQEIKLKALFAANESIEKQST